MALLDPEILAFVLLGAFAGGFVTGLAGFGTGLAASGFWLHVLPPVVVPPLVALSSVAAHAVALVSMRPVMDWRRARPFLIGGVLGVVPGAAMLTVISPDGLRLAVGAFLVLYGTMQGMSRLAWVPRNRVADAGVGFGGGILGGFAGLSAPLPVMWLQMQGGPPDAQRAVYQPFNIVVLAASAGAMAVAGVVNLETLGATVLALPATLGGAWVGARLYRRINARRFRQIVLGLLSVSGVVLVAQSL